MKTQLARAYVALMILIPFAALAHDGGENLIAIDAASDGALKVVWEIPLPSLEDLWHVKTSDGPARQQLAKEHRSEISEAVHDDIYITDGEKPCPLKVVALDETTRDSKLYEMVRFEGRCEGEHFNAVTLQWTFLAGESDDHRALITFRSPGGVQSTTTTNHDLPTKVGMLAENGFAHFLNYVKGGILHIWTGLDHVLFLITLLLPAVFSLTQSSAGRKWEVRETFRPVFFDVLKTVSAFTLAHSITLCLVTFGLLSVPGRFVESVIALSVLLAALNNLFPIAGEGRWKFAFLFGLVHGIGFAEVLVGMKLPLGALINSLVGYNLGVEIGQLAIVAAVLPLTFAARRSAAYRKYIFAGGSIGTAALAAFWLVDRAFNLGLMP